MPPHAQFVIHSDYTVRVTCMAAGECVRVRVTCMAEGECVRVRVACVAEGECVRVRVACVAAGVQSRCRPGSDRLQRCSGMNLERGGEQERAGGGGGGEPARRGGMPAVYRSEPVDGRLSMGRGFA
jgi:hypothetical protein